MVTHFRYGNFLCSKLQTFLMLFGYHRWILTWIFLPEFLSHLKGPIHGRFCVCCCAQLYFYMYLFILPDLHAEPYSILGRILSATTMIVIIISCVCYIMSSSPDQQ